MKKEIFHLAEAEDCSRVVSAATEAPEATAARPEATVKSKSDSRDSKKDDCSFESFEEIQRAFSEQFECSFFFDENLYLEEIKADIIGDSDVSFFVEEENDFVDAEPKMNTKSVQTECPRIPAEIPNDSLLSSPAAPAVSSVLKTSSSKKFTPCILPKPRHSQRLLNGTTVTSAWNDPGNFDHARWAKWATELWQREFANAKQICCSSSDEDHQMKLIR